MGFLYFIAPMEPVPTRGKVTVPHAEPLREDDGVPTTSRSSSRCGRVRVGAGSHPATPTPRMPLAAATVDRVVTACAFQARCSQDWCQPLRSLAPDLHRRERR